MRIFEWIQVALGLLAIGSGATVLRGVLKVTLSGHRVVRFLECSLVASLACLLPLTRHLLPIQGICMLSVYCAGVAVLAWRKFHLAGLWRAIFAFSIVAVLYLDVVSVSMRLFNHFEIAQLLFALAFVALGVLSIRHAQQAQ
jgi:hypothetical protein